MIQKVGESIKNDLKLNMVNGMKNAVNLKEKKKGAFLWRINYYMRNRN